MTGDRHGRNVGGGGVEYHFPVEVEVRNVRSADDGARADAGEDAGPGYHFPVEVEVRAASTADPDAIVEQALTRLARGLSTR